MKDAATMHTGPLGSTIHVLRADPETVAALAAVDWNRHFHRVRLDPVLGIITLMAPSRLHENLTELVDKIVDVAGSSLTGAVSGIRHTRLRGRGEPPGTGMEPDGAFYVGERAKGYFAALREGVAAADDFVVRVAPDLIVETEITSFDEGKIERYGDLGGTGALASSRPQGHRQASGGLPRSRGRPSAAPARRLTGARGTHPGRRVRGGREVASRRDRPRADGYRLGDRAASPAAERPRPRGGSDILREPGPARDRLRIGPVEAAEHSSPSNPPYATVQRGPVGADGRDRPPPGGWSGP